MKQKTLSINKSKSQKMEQNNTDKDLKPHPKAGSKRTIEKRVFKTMASLLEDVFNPVSDGKATPVKSTVAKLNKDHEAAMVGLDMTDKLSSDQIERLTGFVGMNDPEFKTLLNLAVQTQRCRNNQPRQAILDFCAKAVSSNWIMKHTGDVNIYQSLSQGVSFENAGYLSNLTMAINSKYEKRITSSKAIKTKLEEQAKQTEVTKHEIIKPVTTMQLNTQRLSVLAIAYLWAYSAGKDNSDAVLSCLHKLLKGDKEPVDDELGVMHYLAEELFTVRRYPLVSLLGYFTGKCESDKQVAQNATRELSFLKTEKQQLFDKIIANDRQLAVQANEISSLKEELKQLRHESEEHHQDEKAKRVHLKDDTGKVKSKAYNLLNEDVLSPLKLCMSALDREAPKTNVALHHIDLIVEKIEGEISWFTK